MASRFVSYRRLGAADRSLSESGGRAQTTCFWASLKIVMDFAVPGYLLDLTLLRTWRT